MHEADHRYRVSGYVRDDLGKPKGEVSILLEHKESQQKKKVLSNRWGYYEHVFHLHSTNLDDEIIVTVGTERKTHKAKFDPKDNVSERHGTVDFGAPAADSGATWVYGTIGASGVLGLLLYLYIKKRKSTKAPKKQKRKGRHGE